MFSSLFKRTVSSIVASYALTLFLLGGTLITAILISELFFRNHNTLPVFLLLLLNPLSLFEWLYPEFLGQTLSVLGNYPFTADWLKFWHISVLVNTAFCAFCMWISTRAVNPLLGGKRKG